MRVAKLLVKGLLAACMGLPLPLAAEVTVVGWIERVKLGLEGLVLSAKLDTGADTSSLHASDIRWYVRDDGDWVAFDVVNEKGEKVRFERKVLRIARVRRMGGGVQKRPTVLMGVCLGKVYKVTQVTLADRTGFAYEFLVGRRFLAGDFAVDSARTYTVEPECEVTR
jgi:hypothetical protein